MKKELLFKDIRDKINITNSYNNGFIKIVLKNFIWYVKDIKLSPIEIRDNKVVSISVVKCKPKDIRDLGLKFTNFKYIPCILEIRLK